MLSLENYNGLMFHLSLKGKIFFYLLRNKNVTLGNLLVKVSTQPHRLSKGPSDTVCCIKLHFFH